MASSPGILYLVPNLLAPGSPPEACLPATALGRVRELRSFVVEGEKAAWAFLSRVLGPEELRGVAMERLDEHTPADELPRLLEPLERGEDLGLLSEAGMPCVADPGGALVALAHERDIVVVPLVGPSSILLALAASGLEAQRFDFLGYLSLDAQARRAELSAIDRGIRSDGATRIFIETPYRNARLLQECLERFSPATRLCVAASLCSDSERIRSATVADWRARPWPLGKEPAIFLAGPRARTGSASRPQRAGSAALTDRRPGGIVSHRA